MTRRRSILIPRNKPLAIMVALAALASTTGAQAGTASASIAVTATVQAACTVTANNLAFGTYDPSSATPLDISTTMAVTCTNGTSYSVRLNPGATSGATVTTRQMAFSTNRLSYSLFRDAAHTQNWGQTDGTDTATSTGTASAITHTVYGRVPINQYVPPGAYSDTVTVTVNF